MGSKLPARPWTPYPMTGFALTTSQDYRHPPSSQPQKMGNIVIAPILQARRLRRSKWDPGLDTTSAKTAS